MCIHGINNYLQIIIFEISISLWVEFKAAQTGDLYCVSSVEAEPLIHVATQPPTIEDERNPKRYNTMILILNLINLMFLMIILYTLQFHSIESTSSSQSTNDQAISLRFQPNQTNPIP